MHNYPFLLRLLFISLLITLSQYSAAQKWDKYLNKADGYYEEGDYAKANKTLAKFKGKVVKKLGTNNEYMPSYYVRSARFNLAEGNLVDFGLLIDQALAFSTSINGEGTIKHALTQLDVASLLSVYGDFVKARLHVDAARQTLGQADKMDDNSKAKIGMTMAQILTGQGFYNESLEFIEDNMEYFRSRAVTKETYVDGGKLITRRLSDKEVADRLNEYATLLTLKANTLRKKGDYNGADKAFVLAEEWIKRNLGDLHFSYANNQFLHANLLVENGLILKNMPNALKYEKTLSNLKKQHEESHFLAFDLFETLLKQYLETEQRAKYRNLKLEYEKAIKRNFKRTSIHYINLETIEFDSKLDRDKTKNLATKAYAIVAGNPGLPHDYPKTIQIIEFLYRLALQEENFSAAETNLKDILKIKETLYGPESPEYHLSKLQLANHYIDHTDKIKEAENIYAESFFKIVKPQIDLFHKDYVNVLSHLATLYEYTDKYALSTQTLDSALNAAREKFNNEDGDYGVVLNNSAKLYINLADYEKAEQNIEQALAILNEKRKDEVWLLDYVQALETQAKLKAIQGLFDDAESIISRSKKVLKRADSKVGYNELASSEDLASLYITLGKYSATEKLNQTLLNSYEIRYGKNSRRLLNSLNVKGHLQLIHGDYTEAEKTSQRALTIAENTFTKTSSKTTPSLLLQSEIYTSIGDYEKAQAVIQRAIEIQEKQFGRDHVDVGKSIAQLALIKFYKGDDLQEVEKLMLEAQDIVLNKLGNRNPTYANLLTDLAKVYIAEHRFDDAFNSLTLAETIWVSKVGKRNNINAASIYTLNGDIYYLQRNYDKAEENYEKARKLYEKFFNRNHPEYVKVLSKLSKVYYMEGDTRKSKNFIEEALANHQNYIQRFFPALSERQKAKFWNTIKDDFEFYNTLAFRFKDEYKNIEGSVYNNALLTKAILLNSSLKIRERIMNSNDEELKLAYNEWLTKKEELANVFSMSVEQLQENEIDPVVLTHEVEQLEKELSQRSKLFSQSFEDKKIVWNDVQSALKENETAIEMVRFRHFDHVFTDSVIYAAIYIKNKKEQANPSVVLINNGKDLEGKFFKFYRNSIIYKVADRRSYGAYWEPIKNIVGNYSTIYLSADGVYNQINLEVIPTGDGKYVIDNSNIILVSNTKDIKLRQIKTDLVQEQKSASMFGNPDFYLEANASGNINALPGTEVELREVKNLLRTDGWSTNSYTDTEAVEEQIKLLNNPKVLHFATHGFFTPTQESDGTSSLTQNESAASQNPLLRTGLLLTGAGDLLNKTNFNYNLDNGILTAYEAMNLNLDQTELVVLSACETGLGELAVGEGVYGLQRAFLVAGARSLIMSMFKVDDIATQKLMVTFYRKWIATGKMRESFIAAKKEIRTEYRDPIYWGAFIMIGLE